MNGNVIYYSSYESPIGRMTMASGGELLAGLWFDGQKYDGGADARERGEERPLPVFALVSEWLDIYFGGGVPDFVPPLAPELTEFRNAVRGLLLRVPYGATVAYGALASALSARTGKPASARAVGGAVGHNRISIIVPCHRVTGADGSLTGYAGGTDRKAYLLRLERSVCGGKRLSDDYS